VVILGGAAAGVLLTRSSGGGNAAANPGVPPATAKVTRTTLVETKTVSGTLGYGEPVPVGAAETGTITRMAPVGSTVKRGQALFRVDERSVVLLYGSLPLYRPLREGAKGADVNELEGNLAALGFTGFSVDDAYDAASASAMRSAGVGPKLAVRCSATRTLQSGSPSTSRWPMRAWRSRAAR
jgi:hypothetical protein